MEKIFVSLYSLIPESLRWLLLTSRHEKAQQQIRTACRFNKIPYPDIDTKNIVLSGTRTAKATMWYMYKMSLKGSKPKNS